MQDQELFGEEMHPRLRSATEDLSWLLGRGYSERASVALVGDRHQLVERQRTAVRRCACAEASLESRGARQLGIEQVRGRPLLIDGFNLLITLEVALTEGLLLEGKDGCIRDLAGASRGPKRSAEALALTATALSPLNVDVHWLFDRPISGSGTLRGEVEKFAEARGLRWSAEVVSDPDPVLIQAKAPQVSATADSGILERCGAWFNLARWVIESAQLSVWMLRLG